MSSHFNVLYPKFDFLLSGEKIHLYAIAYLSAIDTILLYIFIHIYMYICKHFTACKTTNHQTIDFENVECCKVLDF